MDPVRAAFRAECVRLSEILSELDDVDLDRPTDCPPWTVRELIAHVRTGAGRLADMLAAPAPPHAEVDAAGYFGAAKFTPEVDAARIEAARSEAARSEVGRSGAGRSGAGRIAGGGRVVRPVGGSAVRGEFEHAWRAADAAVAAAAPERVVRTRHGDLMRLTEFLRTRVVEVGVHGLDLAAALDRPPWLTPQAAVVIADLLTGGRPAPAGLRWDRLTLIRKTTGRAALTPAERAEIDVAGFRWLAFGQ
ncbi:maleylpyruvate isomerase N-terminal domain-containing protein [Micromonospora sp. WMMD710]|uniref:maleylpyruvate isomerase N-terminal domain-containing protein n=1 Tax=Micromonospora sp. WMMD710 TaxID=3016085 RepID=UPI002415E9D2|nr:maleylpyruvate isomerase N-terminal domain-containing protein [Micromonospora sp. WMMD710]MDG4757228.1 maleylpyruvate isomerase N-terminal domain-containing protein [Micromonospora sp. WMMD710]